MSPTALSTTKPGDRDALHARLAAREEGIRPLEGESRWLKTQLFGRASQKTGLKERHPDQAGLLNEPKVLARASRCVPVSVMIPTHEHGKSGCKRLSATQSWVMVMVHEFSEEQKICASGGTQRTRIGEELSERLDASIAVKP